MVVAIDGPAGAGKSTVARELALKTGMFYLNSGNFYRAVTLEVLRRGADPKDSEAITKIAGECSLSIRHDRLFLNGEDVEDLLHTDAVDAWVAEHSAIIPVRHVVNGHLRRIAKDMDIIVEGRDITTVVFPDAEVKLYLDASVETRARRRHEQGVSSLQFTEILENIKKRDHIDRNKPLGSLKQAPDSIYLDTSGLTIHEVCEKVLEKIRHSKK
ncbi:MAG: (d)CMP kinase [Spirochaetales bacterium]|nr:MAG: (d)CMP kinase [Spirochaetales bacterium]